MHFNEEVSESLSKDFRLARQRKTKERQQTAQLKERQQTAQLKERQQTAQLKERQQTAQLKERQQTAQLKERQQTAQLKSFTFARKRLYRSFSKILNAVRLLGVKFIFFIPLRMVFCFEVFKVIIISFTISF